MIVADDFSSGARLNLTQHPRGGKVRVIETDIRDADKSERIVRGVDVIYHLAVQCIRLFIPRPVSCSRGECDGHVKRSDGGVR